MDRVATIKAFCNKNKKPILWSVFAVYGVFTLFGAAFHELWFDEAQAWNIARDNDIGGIIGMMRYEGHPPLWHFILFCFSHLGFGAGILPYISCFFSLAAVAVILFKSPFQMAVKMIIVFSGGFLFYNSVISRVYCIAQLIICLIACIYPDRKKHPVFYGLLIALLANTHVVLCGLVGILGIYEIIDFVKDFRGNTAKKNALNLTGLCLSGLGVLLLILPLIGSLSSNYLTSEKASLFSTSELGSLIMVNLNTVYHYWGSGIAWPVVTFALSAFAGLIILAIPVLLRKSTRAFFILICSMVFYYVVCGIIWYTNVNRAALFFLVIIVVLWIAATDDDFVPKRKETALPHMDTKILRNIVSFVFKADANWYRTSLILVCSVMAISIPFGAICLAKEYFQEFSPGKETSEYILESFPDDSLFVTNSDSEGVVISAYLPEARFYSLSYASFYTYCSHKKCENEYDNAKIADDISKYKHIYYVGQADEDFFVWNTNIEPIYIHCGYIPILSANAEAIYITKFDMDMLN